MISPTKMANIVPTGIDFLGSFKSPDMATPAVKPVTAGKKTPKIMAKLGASSRLTAEKSNPFPSELPKKTDINESAIAARMRYWIFIAKLVLIYAIVTIKSSAIVPAMRKWFMVISSICSQSWTTIKTLSAKPIRYSEILRAVAKYRVNPMAPPIGKPKLLESI